MRHDALDEIVRLVVDVLAFDQDFADFVGQVVAQCTNDRVAFLVNEKRTRPLGDRLLDRLPDVQQVVEVPLQLLAAATDASRAHDDAHAIRHVQCTQDIAQLGALVALDAARDAAGTGIVGHQHQEASCQADKRGQRRALGAALFLVNLDNQFLALAQHFLDLHLCARQRVRS